MAIVKDLAFGDEARQKLISGINKISDAVKSTLGARGNTVLLESEHHIGGLTITKDGITVARAITLEDPIENLAVELVRQAADRTAVHAADGTTTSIVLTQALVLKADELIKPHMNKMAVIRHLRLAAEQVINRIKDMAIPITDENLRNVAVISANGDVSLGEMIADAYQQTGLKGTILIDKSKTPYSYSEITNGMRLNRGWTSKYFVTDAAKQETVMLNPYILVCDQKINSLQDIEPLLALAISQRRPFLIIGDVSENTLESMNLSMVKRAAHLCHVQSGMGWKGAEIQEDIAIMTGAHYWAKGASDNLELINADALGSAEKVIIGLDHTVIIPHEDEEIELRKEGRITELEQRIKESTDVNETNYLKERLSNLQGAIGKVYIGAVSDIEYKELKDRADDCVAATAAAISDGIVPGGGVALLSISKFMPYGEDEESRVAWHILRHALQAPFYQILTNGGLQLSDQDERAVGSNRNGVGVDAVTGELVNMVDAGIIDPAKITITALSNAVSVATTLLSTNCVITNVRANDRN
jgi:chaperonin GroEL